MKTRRSGLLGCTGLALSLGLSPASAMSLAEAVQKTLSSNPQVLAAGENREATEFELRQARGAYLPSVDLEAGYGKRRLLSPSTGGNYTNLTPSYTSLTITQRLFDGGARRAEVDRQAARVDGASFRVAERSENLALQAVQYYLEYVLQAEIVRVAQENKAFHQKMLGDIEQSIAGGALTDADRLQGRERLEAANARVVEAVQALEDADARFIRVVGEPIGTVKTPGSISKSLPQNVEDALQIARANSPAVKAGRADIDAADAAVRGTRSEYLPKVDLEGVATLGNDTSGTAGRTNSYQVGLVARWNLFNGGKDIAREQEYVRRSGESRMALDDTYRAIEEAVRSAWSERKNNGALSATLSRQSNANDQLVSSYREQFRVGNRSLLEVLDAQNARFNTAVQARISKVAAIFAEYKLLAAMGKLSDTMGGKQVAQAGAYAREEFGVKSLDDPGYKKLSAHQKANMPFDLLAPLRDK
ncbi:TolC family outer membrane protein [Rhizobium sp. L1K21]|uniref:TolC family outer membrane protein n=1 Tax=Rhizobium sp. L1K21 TaxID=2954933 RepID=UPI002093D49E|nr:TolC family outer membrane protein [Rhizobium sp. L1K21]MCO6187037.1 TolC family outer membrane protein [Rhizobium sp. L1K21]